MKFMGTDKMWSLTLLRYIHLIATVAWIGGLFSIVTAVIPSAEKRLQPPAARAFMNSFMRRSRLVGYSSIVILAISGVLLTIIEKEPSTLWKEFIYLKHGVIAILIIVTVYLHESIIPKIAQLATDSTSELEEVKAFEKKEKVFSVVIIILSLITLFLSTLSESVG
ncbi:hypothetical protein AKJ57_03760 [candidate division MSBL1 archaeon SCGC-AAA259A05]|uniref:Copper resistance protein D domain-containing protein n=1 Tax=candidate division MSBL1 archaeon SCGC-AAA259A05 TaxID=1698259 RepID=A0A133U9B1_9EURY|nr:hypothetical protein AKJ57_03760 [candidate division MSBL1 archaeon SCGC-AAA259A05]